MLEEPMATINENGFWKHIESEANEVWYRSCPLFFLSPKRPNMQSFHKSG